MGVKRYMISDASKHVNVESHVLRYWEEELGLEIARNELGHRYYTEENLKLFKHIKTLKEQGFQLKAIKMIIPELEATGDAGLEYMMGRREELNEKADEEENVENVLSNTPAVTDKSAFLGGSQDKMQQFQLIMSNIVTKALQENNMLLSKEVSSKVSDNVLKEMDYLMRIREEKDDERYKQLDETIRNVQKNRKSLDKQATLRPEKLRKKKRAFGRAVV